MMSTHIVFITFFVYISFISQLTMATLILTLSVFFFWNNLQFLLQIPFEMQQCVGHEETKDLW